MTRRTKASRSRTLVAVLAIGVAAMVALPANGSASADRGDLDTTFGGTGQVAAGPTTSAEQGYEVAVDPTTGRVYVAAIETVFPAGMPQVFVAAFTSDGVLDTSFGVGGIARTGISAAVEAGVGLGISPDGGRVYVASLALAGEFQDRAYVAAFTAEGTLDDTFSDDGLSTTGLVGSPEGGYALAVDPSGRVYVATLELGVVGATYGYFTVAAFAPDGQLDPAFADDGIAYGPGTQGYFRGGFALTLDPATGRVYLAGSSARDGGATLAFMLAFTPDGPLDTGFGTGGSVLIPRARVTPEATGRYGLAVDADRDRVYLASNDPTTSPYVIALSTDGSAAGNIDYRFGDEGIVHTTLAGSSYSGQSVAVDPADGTVFLITYSNAGTFPNEVYVAAFNPDGGPDETFGNSGLATTGAGSGSEAGSRGVVDPATGRLYVANYTNAHGALVSAFQIADGPTAVADVATVAHDRPLVVPDPGVLGNDLHPTGAPLTIAGYDAVTTQGGSIAATPAGGYTYTPPAGFVGDDTFTYDVTDGVRTASAIVTITVTNAAPVPPATPPAYTTPYEHVLEVAAPGVLSGASDPDGDALSVGLVDGAAPLAGSEAVALATGTSPAGATVILNADGSFTYTPPAGFSGADQVTFTISDGVAVTGVVTAVITVADPPPVTTPPETTMPPAPPVTTVPPAVTGAELPATGGGSIPPALIGGLLLAGLGACIVARRRSHT